MRRQLKINEERLQNEYEVRRVAWSAYVRDITAGKATPQLERDEYVRRYLQPAVDQFVGAHDES